MQGLAVLLGSMIAAAAVSLPFAWVDRTKCGSLFRASLAIMFALWSFGAVIAELMPGGGAGAAIEPGSMTLAGAFMFSALEAAAPGRRYSPPVFVVAVLIGIAAVFPPFSQEFDRWDSVGACFWSSCTLSGLCLYTIRAGRWRTARVEERPVLAAALSFAVVNLSQIVRMTMHGPGAETIILVTVPIVLALMGVLASRRLALQFANAPPRYEKSGLSGTAADHLFRRIEHLMASTKPFTDPELNRDGLAALLDVDARAIGEAVNRAGGASLAGYLRQKRLAEADRLLAAPENAQVSLEALGMQAGFRSRSRFYVACQEAYGETPGARRKRLQSG